MNLSDLNNLPLSTIAAYCAGVLGLLFFLSALGLPLPSTLFVVAAGAAVGCGLPHGEVVAAGAVVGAGEPHGFVAAGATVAVGAGEPQPCSAAGEVGDSAAGPFSGPSFPFVAPPSRAGAFAWLTGTAPSWVGEPTPSAWFVPSGVASSPIFALQAPVFIAPIKKAAAKK